MQEWDKTLACWYTQEQKKKQQAGNIEIYAAHEV